MSHTYWLGVPFTKEIRAKRIASICEVLKDIDFDSIAVRGVSGLVMGPIVAHVMDKHLIVSRKEDPTGHSIRTVEMSEYSRRYVILDDFVSSGDTLVKIVSDVDLELVGVCCYGQPMDAVRYTPASSENCKRTLAGERYVFNK